MLYQVGMEFFTSEQLVCKCKGNKSCMKNNLTVGSCGFLRLRRFGHKHTDQNNLLESKQVNPNANPSHTHECYARMYEKFPLSPSHIL